MKLSRKLIAAAIAATALWAPGAFAEEREANIGEKVFYYFPNRVMDFLDIFQVGLAFGPGFGGQQGVDIVFVGLWRLRLTGR